MRLFRMNFSQARVRLVQAGAVFAAAALVAGCGNNYRPVVTPVNPSGPPAQPQSYAVVVTAPSPTTPGIATVIDYAGDSILARLPSAPARRIYPGRNRHHRLHHQQRWHLDQHPYFHNLQTKNVNYTTLPSTAKPLEPVLAIGRTVGCGSLWERCRCFHRRPSDLAAFHSAGAYAGHGGGSWPSRLALLRSEPEHCHSHRSGVQ
jgi:hypothetical protein